MKLDVGVLKQWLHKPLPPTDKLLLVLASFDTPCSIAELRRRALDAGFKFPNKWNVSAILARTKGLAIRVPEGWELSDSGKQHLGKLGITKLSPTSLQVAADLRSHLLKIKNPTTAAFVEEAIRCHEAQLFRSAIVMSWIAAVDVLYREIVASHLQAFNAEAVKVNSKWKAAVNEDGLSRMGEADFLDRITAINVIGKNTKDELVKCLKLRNGCGHPNSLKVGPNMVATHLEALLLNVFEIYTR